VESTLDRGVSIWREAQNPAGRPFADWQAAESARGIHRWWKLARFLVAVRCFPPSTLSAVILFSMRVRLLRLQDESGTLFVAS